jgi:hypothetical protein
MHAKDTKPAIDDATKQMGQMDQRGQMREMHGDKQDHGAHLHLIVDSPLPKTGMMVPMDENHIHLMHGEYSMSGRICCDAQRGHPAHRERPSTHWSA